MSFFLVLLDVKQRQQTLPTERERGREGETRRGREGGREREREGESKHERDRDRQTQEGGGRLFHACLAMHMDGLLQLICLESLILSMIL